MTLSVRRPSPRFVCLTCAAALLAGLFAAVEAQTPSVERDFLTRIRRLTVEGRRAGEGYWSKDGRQLVFQSEREPGNPFYQIYLMDMASGDVTRMSPGTGKTTCSFINPATGDVLFASTHHDPDRNSCRTRSWRSAPRARSAATRGTTTRRWSSTSATRRLAPSVV